MIPLLVMVNLQVLEKLLHSHTVQSVRVQGLLEDSTGKCKQHHQGYSLELAAKQAVIAMVAKCTIY